MLCSALLCYALLCYAMLGVACVSCWKKSKETNVEGMPPKKSGCRLAESTFSSNMFSSGCTSSSECVPEGMVVGVGRRGVEEGGGG